MFNVDDGDADDVVTRCAYPLIVSHCAAVEGPIHAGHCPSEHGLQTPSAEFLLSDPTGRQRMWMPKLFNQQCGLRVLI